MGHERRQIIICLRVLRELRGGKDRRGEGRRRRGVRRDDRARMPEA